MCNISPVLVTGNPKPADTTGFWSAGKYFINDVTFFHLHICIKIKKLYGYEKN